MLCFTGKKPVPFTDKPYKTLVCIRKYYLFSRFHRDRMFLKSYHVTTTLVQANQAVAAISSSEIILTPKEFLKIPNSKEFSRSELCTILGADSHVLLLFHNFFLQIKKKNSVKTDSTCSVVCWLPSFQITLIFPKSEHIERKF